MDKFIKYIDIIQKINDCNDREQLINTIHTHLKINFPIIESRIFLLNISGELQKESSEYSTIIDKIVNKLEEEAIIDWCFSTRKITIIPNIYDDSIKSKTFIIIIPVLNDNKNIGLFITISDKDKNDYSEIELKEIESIGNLSVLRMNSIKRTSEIDILNNRLRYLNSEILKSSEMSALGEIISGISGEIDAPIKIIEANQKLIKSGSSDLERRLEIIAEQLLKLSKINSKLKEISNEDLEQQITQKVKLNEMIDDAILLSESQLRKDGIVIEYENDQKLFTIGIKNQIEHLILSLILYSKDLMPDGGKIKITLFNSNKRNFIMISDDGIGFGDDEIANIFDPAFEIKKGSQVITGLYVLQQIAKKLKGDIEITSKSGNGTTYKLILPSSLK